MPNIYNHSTFRREQDSETGGNKYFCNFCPNVFETYNGVKSHIRRKHAVEKSGTTSTQKSIATSYSDKTRWPWLDELVEHRNMRMRGAPPSMRRRFDDGDDGYDSEEKRRERFFLSEIRRLRAEGERRDKEERKRQDNETHELKEKIRKLQLEILKKQQEATSSVKL